MEKFLIVGIGIISALFAFTTGGGLIFQSLVSGILADEYWVRAIFSFLGLLDIFCGFIVCFMVWEYLTTG